MLPRRQVANQDHQELMVFLEIVKGDFFVFFSCSTSNMKSNEAEVLVIQKAAF